MKLISTIVFLSCLILFTLNSAYSTTTFLPPAFTDLGDLDHLYYYSWGINWSIPSGEHISKATLTFYNIYNWTSESDDRLYIRLCNELNPLSLTYLMGQNTSGKLWRGSDNAGMTDAFAGKGINIINALSPPKEWWTDETDTQPETLKFEFNPALLNTLESYALDGKFSLNFDPDCHYYNDKVEFLIETETSPDTPTDPPTPEPSTLILIGTGLVGIVSYGRIKFYKKK